MNEVIQKKLPDGWQLCKLGDVMRLKNGYAFKSKDYSETGIPLIRISDLKEGVVNIDKSVCIPNELLHEGYFVETGDLLIAMSGATTGKIGVYKGAEPVLQNQRVGNIKIIDESVVDKRYRDYFVSSLRKEIEGAAYGGAQPNISAKDIESFEIPLAPHEQQKRIVAKIEELFSHIDAGIEALKKAQQLLKQYRQSVLKAAVTGELTKSWRDAQGRASVAVGRKPGATKLEPASQLLERILKERRQKWEEQQLKQFQAKGKMPKDDKWKGKYKELALITGEERETLPEIPVGWVYTRLGNVIEEPQYGTSKKCNYDSSGIGVLRIPNIANRKIDSEDLKFAQFDNSEVKTYHLLEGDILTIRSNGSIKLVGKCALIDANMTEYLYAGYLIRLRSNQRLADGSYLINALNSVYLRNQIESKAKSTSGVNNINSGELQALIIPICSKEEQVLANVQVDQRLVSTDKLALEIERQLAKAEKNKQSILTSAFSGEFGGRD